MTSPSKIPCRFCGGLPEAKQEEDPSKCDDCTFCHDETLMEGVMYSWCLRLDKWCNDVRNSCDGPIPPEGVEE